MEIRKEKDLKSWLWGQNEFLMSPHPLTNFEIEKYYQNEPIFSGVYSRDNLPKKIKDGTYVINLDKTLMLEHIGLLCM